MKIYLVGGAVRDELLSRRVTDRDYVVVGATHEQMIAQGFTQVGAAFPVYLHPATGEEYALARTERKVGDGHKGFETFFSPDVTLEEDLSRRDLTINAMAKDLDTGEIIDPFNGQTDLRRKILRHTTEAFMDDPLRILRMFRFASQLGETWRIAGVTWHLAFTNRHRLVEISPERKWKEMEKALNSRNFMQYAESMSTFGELPELYDQIGVQQPKEHHPEGDAFAHTLRCLEECDRYNMSPEVKFAVLCHDFGKAVTWKERGDLLGHEAAGVPVTKAFCERMRVPKVYEELALVVTEFHMDMHTMIGRPGQNDKKPNKVMKLLERTGSLKNNRRAIDFANACSMDQAGRGLPKSWLKPYPQADIFLSCQAAVVSLDVKPISARLLERGVPGIQIGEAIRVERIDAIRKTLRECKEMRDGKES